MNVFCIALQIIICMFCPFLIFPLIYFVPDEHHEREAAARRTQKSLNSKSMRNVRRRSDTGEGVELQKVETVNGNPKTTADEEATVGADGDDLVDYIPGKRAFDRNINSLHWSPLITCNVTSENLVLHRHSRVDESDKIFSRIVGGKKWRNNLLFDFSFKIQHWVPPVSVKFFAII